VKRPKIITVLCNGHSPTDASACNGNVTAVAKVSGYIPVSECLPGFISVLPRAGLERRGLIYYIRPKTAFTLTQVKFTLR
jgi:hypothetical protein